MFCSSLRKRREWASVPSTLLSQQQPRWKEQLLEAHDLAIPLPKEHEQDQQDIFRLLLLSSSDLGHPRASTERIQRLYHQTGGLHVGIVFLFNEISQNGDGTISFMSLQATLSTTDFDMPVLPLASITSLQTTLFSFQRQLFQPRSTIPSPRVDVPTALLPYCSLHPPLPEHARNVLSDVCQSIPQLAHTATTPDGQQYLRQYLSEPNPATPEDIIAFWSQEYVVD